MLFDLDGTLIDSAPDLAGACNDMRIERGLAPLPLRAAAAAWSARARAAWSGAAFGIAPGDAGYDALRDEFLARYEARMTRADQGLRRHGAGAARGSASRGLPWGIVTNKATRFAAPLVAGARRWHERAAALVCGDTTPHAKPHPAPLLEAARRLGAARRQRCVYVGDDLRDVRCRPRRGHGARSSPPGAISAPATPLQTGAPIASSIGRTSSGLIGGS